MDAKAIRLANLRLLMTPYKKKAHFARRAGMDPSHLGQILSGRRKIGDDLPRNIERQLGLETGWMDVLHEPFSVDPEIVRLAEELAALPAARLVSLLRDAGLTWRPGNAQRAPLALPAPPSEPNDLTTLGEIRHVPRIVKKEILGSVRPDVPSGKEFRE
jgi:transcriptional regulator with XRE-family HTH domain